MYFCPLQRCNLGRILHLKYHMPTLRRGVCPARGPGCLGVPGTMIFDPPLEVLAASASSDSFLAALNSVHAVSNLAE